MLEAREVMIEAEAATRMIACDAFQNSSMIETSFISCGYADADSEARVEDEGILARMRTMGRDTCSKVI